jgi:YHS domain-containing protein
MELLDLLLIVLAVFGARACWRVIGGIMEGLSDRPATPARQGRGGVPQQGVQMARDPVCGTYVVPDRAVALADGHGRVFFCSTACRDQYRSKTA